MLRTFLSQTVGNKRNEIMILSISLCVILIGLGLIHFNWVVGGKFGFEQALPTKANGEKVFKPKKIDSAIVGIGLTMFGVFYLLKAGLIALTTPEWIFKYGSWIIPILFLLRAMGEFKYVGFFKRVKNTEFGKWDTRLFSPLCLMIGIGGIIIQIIE
jgi:hypothetical protein